MMKNVLKITKSDLDVNFFYIGAVDVANEFDGSIKIDGALGLVKFKTSLKAKGSIEIESGTFIEAGWSIKAGTSIKAGESIKAGWSIKAGLQISAKWISAGFRIFAGLCDWKVPKEEETEIQAELRGGTISFGKHVPPQKEPTA